jgi:hypothetical protein
VTPVLIAAAVQNTQPRDARRSLWGAGERSWREPSMEIGDAPAHLAVKYRPVRGDLITLV